MAERQKNRPGQFQLATMLLAGIGISTLGDFIYLVAINVLVFKLTGSAAAVAGLWVIRPIASLLINSWSGSMIDRFNKRQIMIITDIIRGGVLLVLPFVTSLWYIYPLLFALGVCSCFFVPTSTTYMTKVIPIESRKQFNSLRSLIKSGSFIIGPAIAGGLLLSFSPAVAIYINAVSFFISAIIIYYLPDAADEGNETASKVAVSSNRLSLSMIKLDWQQFFRYSKMNLYVMLVYSIFEFVMLFTLALDAQEVVFIQQVLQLSETDYGLLMSITGIGSLAGSMLNTAIVKRTPLHYLIGVGTLFVALGYLIYAFSFSFLSVVVGFVLLAFAGSFANTGMITFFQNNVPTEQMGRISSLFGFFLSVLQIMITVLVGLIGYMVPIRSIIIVGALLMFAASLLLFVLVMLPTKKRYFQENVATEG
ncbi:MFS transporter [Brevibacillus daliensis]|uniref:MFS transporter n=1 Tax=Brevibacillus daliensis TaxID=2892995 RepID=UPI001E2A39CB|nr:MFS transporter [Brevibacillus daliensis]